MKKIICFLLLSIFCFCGLGTLSGCRGIGLRLYESEYFIYKVNGITNNIQILGLTDNGKEQEFLVIPETIDGMTVKKIGCSDGLSVSNIEKKYGSRGYAQFKSDKLKKLFIIPEVDIIEGWMVDEIIDAKESFEGVFYVSNQYGAITTPDVFFFITSLRGKKYGFNNIVSTGPWYAANVSYFYNFKNSKNEGYYWIDNYGHGEKIEYIPENPTRDGYTFDGWYKESECINKWNFEVDTLPEEQFNEEEITIYQETKLYAKWIEN